jgi:hypothetical protein
MPEYTVKTVNDRNLVIEADSYALNYNQTAFEFSKDDKVIASVLNNPNVFAIVETDSVLSDHYSVYDWNVEDEKEELDDVCTNCRNQELFDSEEFWDAVWEVVEAWHEPDEPETTPAEEPA